MEDNAFVALIQKIRDDNKSYYPTTHRYGRVISIMPLRIEVNSLVYEQHELLKSEHLKQFELGEELLLIPIDDEQRFIIIAKVVDA